MRILFATHARRRAHRAAVPFAHACSRAGHDVLRRRAALVRRAPRRAAPGCRSRASTSPTRRSLAPIWARVRAADRRRAGPDRLRGGLRRRVRALRAAADARARAPLAPGRDRARDERVRVAARRDAIGVPTSTSRASSRASAIATRARRGAGPLRPGLTAATARRAVPDARPALARAPATSRGPGTRRFRAPRPRRAQPLPDWWGGSARAARLRLLRLRGGRQRLLPRPLPRGGRRARRRCRCRVLLTLGTEVDPAELGPVPGNVHVERVGAAGRGHARTRRRWSATAARARRWRRWPPGCRSRSCRCSPTSPRTPPASPRSAPACALDGVDGLADAVRALLDDPFYRANARRSRPRSPRTPPVDDVVDAPARDSRRGRRRSPLSARSAAVSWPRTGRGR